MIERLYIHNFRCFENFELILKEMPTALLLGTNGSGKSSVRQVLTILQRIGFGVSRLDQLLRPEDFGRGRKTLPIRFEIEALISGRPYLYTLAVELSGDPAELHVHEERLIAGGEPVYSRRQAEVTQHNAGGAAESVFLIDGKTIALSILQGRNEPNDLGTFKNWLASMVVLAPIPSTMSGDSTGNEGWWQAITDGSKFGEWFTWLIDTYPAADSIIEQSLRNQMPDFGEISKIPVGPSIERTKRMSLSFRKDHAETAIAFPDLSDGEKCFLLGAVVVAMNKVFPSLVCFWDEPDNYLSLSEVGHFVMDLRRSFSSGGQLLITSHNPEAIRKFSDENTLVLYRNSHLEPTQVRRLEELTVHGDLVEALIRGDVGP